MLPILLLPKATGTQIDRNIYIFKTYNLIFKYLKLRHLDAGPNKIFVNYVNFIFIVVQIKFIFATF